MCKCLPYFMIAKGLLIARCAESQRLLRRHCGICLSSWWLSVSCAWVVVRGLMVNWRCIWNLNKSIILLRADGANSLKVTGQMENSDPLLIKHPPTEYIHSQPCSALLYFMNPWSRRDIHCLLEHILGWRPNIMRTNYNLQDNEWGMLLMCRKLCQSIFYQSVVIIRMKTSSLLVNNENLSLASTPWSVGQSSSSEAIGTSANRALRLRKDDEN